MKEGNARLGDCRLGDLTGLNAYPLPSGLRLAYSQLGTVVELHAARLLRLPLPVVSVEIEN